MERLSLTPAAALFDYVIGNPKALAGGKRYLEADLNRSAPGRAKGKAYEERRAFELMRQFKPYRYVVDLHETRANDRMILILMKLTPRTLALASAFPVADILYWPSGKPTGPLTQFVPRGLEVESGTKTSFGKTQRKLQRVLKVFLKNLDLIPAQEKALRRKTALPKGKRFFHVYATIDPQEVTDPSKLRDFRPARSRQGERFVALLFGKFAGLTGYKMRLMDAADVARHREP